MIINDLKYKMDYAIFFLSISKSLKNIRSVETHPTWNIKLFGENNNKSNARDAIFIFFTNC